MPPDTSEPDLAEFWTSYVDGRRRGAAFAVRHPVRVWRAFRATRRLTVIEAKPTTSPEGTAIRATLETRGPLAAPARLLGTAVLAVPADPAEHVGGRSAQTLRRKIRAAERAGVTWRVVTDPEERRSLLETANSAEREHPDPAYRVVAPRNDDLLDHDLWLVAVDAAGTPILLSVTPVDGEIATLRYFRTLGSGPAHSDSRYLMTHALVTELAHRGVRWLLDTEPPGAQTNGLRHFQRMVGFRYARVRLRRGGAGRLAAAALPAYVSAGLCLEQAMELVA
ncbi:hypothetical protein [Nocardioides sp.]|uniref:hypothetical protein n=1 Tax=Nocardioides sp. TaxID=35761 RepID=UPI001A23472B|nr:hypothetical protein [Nocardioides sp.]MBJ7357677.1 hypothetical protein [Nocardioides sp.]